MVRALAVMASLWLCGCGRYGYQSGDSDAAGGDTTIDDGPDAAQLSDAATTDPALDLCVDLASGGHDYALCPTLRDWAGAAAGCAARGLALARIDDATEDDLVYTMARAVPTEQILWLGGTDAAVENEWVWPDGAMFWQAGTSLLYTGWQRKEPNNRGGEDCLTVSGSGWNDEACDHAHPYICRTP